MWKFALRSGLPWAAVKSGSEGSWPCTSRDSNSRTLDVTGTVRLSWVLGVPTRTPLSAAEG